MDVINMMLLHLHFSMKGVMMEGCNDGRSKARSIKQFLHSDIQVYVQDSFPFNLIDSKCHG